MARRPAPLIIEKDSKLYLNIKVIAYLEPKTSLSILQIKGWKGLKLIEHNNAKYAELNEAIKWKQDYGKVDGEIEDQLDPVEEDAKLKRIRRLKIEKELDILNGSHRPIEELDEAQANFIKTFLSIMDSETYKLDEDNRLKVQRWLSDALKRAKEVFEKYVK